ncbi:relaxase domain-containing protein [Acidithiobacillus sp. 'AMD consortium']|uniref:MobF family relaxase n=1 Tax=Acidithiobacillus sp. 'AMD consortium' TaxID=2614801 RepID=UPI00124DEB61|nr:MobF family relaxase [Acidithiobacillus sp. 'AMD consortium']QFG77814.1 relaxase domain-containing protein [Acidithiobacillus sp. 'AMD consortium']
MINIGAITSPVGAANYYTSTDSSVSQEAVGAYYTNQNQIASTWQGAGADLAGLEGKAVTKEAIQKILEGKVQQIGKDGLIEEKQLGRTVKDENGNSVIEHRAGFDLTFSSPKSVSIESEVWGKTDVRDAHEAAIKTAMGFLEEKAALTRMSTGAKDENGKAITEIVKTGNLTFASFQHATSREGDPQTHTHVLVANVTYGADGKARSLESKGIFQWRATADQVYKNELARGLEKLGYQVEWDQKGSFEIAGYSKENLDIFSKRSEQVDAALKEKGMAKATASAEARQTAVFATRKDKATGHSERAEDHRPGWQTEAKENGIAPAARDGYSKENVAEYREAQDHRFQNQQGHQDNIAENREEKHQQQDEHVDQNQRTEDQKWRGAGQRINEFSPPPRQEQRWSNGIQARAQDDKIHHNQGTEWTQKGRASGAPRLNLGSNRIGQSPNQLAVPTVKSGKFETGRKIYATMQIFGEMKGMSRDAKDVLLAKAALETHQKIWFKPNNEKLNELGKNPTVAVNYDSTGNRYYTTKDGKTFRDDLYRKQTSMQSSNWKHLGLTKSDYNVTNKGVFKSGGTLKSELFGHVGSKTRQNIAGKMHKGIASARKGYFKKEHGAFRAHDKALYHRGVAWAEKKASGAVLNGGHDWKKVGTFTELYVRARTSISTMKAKAAALKDIKEKAAGNVSTKSQTENERSTIKADKNGGNATQGTSNNDSNSSSHQQAAVLLNPNKPGTASASTPTPVNDPKAKLLAEPRNNEQPKTSDVSTISINGEKKLSQADVAVQKAIAHITENEFRFTEKELWKQVARYSEGNVSFSALQKGIDRAIKNGTIIDRKAQDPNQAAHVGILGQVFTTKEAMAQEKSMAQSLVNGRSSHQAVMTKEEFDKALTTFEKEKGFNLSEEQKTAASMILTKNDQFSGVQGLAGTGKTTLLEFVRVAAESAGWKVEGFATGAAQAEKLQEESGIQSTTTARFLLDNQKESAGNSEGHQKTLRIMDEASLAGQKQFNQVINVNEQQDSKVIFLGDKLQHQSVDAGTAFGTAQKYMPMSSLADIRRQTSDQAKSAVSLMLGIMNCKEVNEAFGLATTLLEKVGVANSFNVDAVRDKWGKDKPKDGPLLDQMKAELSEAHTKDNIALVNEIAKDYASQTPEERDKTLIVSATRVDRAAINDAVRDELKAQGLLQNGQKFTTLQSADMTKEESLKASSYEKGDILKFTAEIKSLDIQKGEEVRVIGKGQRMANSLLVETKDGRKLEINLSKIKGFEAYKETVKEYAVGDKVFFTKNDKESGLKNGYGGEITKIDKNMMTVKLQNGREVVVDTDKYKHIDHRYAMTSHASQGQTVHRVFIHHNVDAGRHGQREMYVNITREREEARIYHNDSERTIKQITVASSKTTAHDTNSRFKVEPQVKVATVEPVTNIKLPDNNSVSSSDKGLKNGTATEVLKRLIDKGESRKTNLRPTPQGQGAGAKSAADKSKSSTTPPQSRPNDGGSKGSSSGSSKGADAGR